MFPSRRATLGGDVFRDEYSLAFDGTDDYVELASPFESTFGASFSVSCWFKADDGRPSSSEAIFGARDDDAADSRVYLFIENSGKIFCQYDVEGTTINAQSASAELADGQQTWKHIVLVINDTTNQISIYLDNKLVTLDGTNDGDLASTDLSTYESDNNMFIGAASNNGSADLEYAGKISEWVLYSTALTASQIATIYNGREPYNHKEGIESGSLVGWWRMGDGILDHKQAKGVIGDEVNPTIGTELISVASQSGTITPTSSPFYSDHDGTSSEQAQQASISSGTITFDTSSEGDWETLSYTGTPSTTGVYKLILTVTRTAGSFNIYSNRSPDYVSRNIDSSGTYTTYLRHEDTGWLVRFGSSSFVGTISDISLKLINGSAGVMTNISSANFKGDTP